MTLLSSKLKSLFASRGTIQYCLAAAILGLVAIVVFLLSFLTPLYNDSIVYMFNHANGLPISSPLDIPKSVFAHFFQTNGRFVSTIITQLIMVYTSKLVFSALNAFVYVMIVIAIMKLSQIRWTDTFSLFTCATMVLIATNVMYNAPAQIVHIWISAIQLLWLLTYFKYREAKVGKLLALVLFIFSIIAGNGVETVNFGISVALAYDFFKNIRRPTLTRYLMIIGYALGCFVLILSPTARERGTSLEPTFLYACYVMLMHTHILLLMVGMLVTALMARTVNLRRFFSDNVFELIIVAALFILNLAISIRSYRQLLGVQLFSIIPALYLFNNIKSRGHNIIVWTCMCIVAAICISTYIQKFRVINEFRDNHAKITSIIDKNGPGTFYVDLKSSPTSLEVIENIDYRYARDMRYRIKCLKLYQLMQKGQSVNFFDCDEWGQYKFLPSAMGDSTLRPDKNYVFKLAPQLYLLMQSRTHKANFVCHRKLDVPFFSIGFHDYTVSFDPLSEFNTDTHYVVISDFFCPFAEISDIEVHLPEQCDSSTEHPCE